MCKYLDNGFWIVDVLVFLKSNFEDFRFCSATLNRYLVIGNFRLQDNCLGQVTL